MTPRLLPDCSRLAAAAPEVWLRVGNRLREVGLDEFQAARFLNIAGDVSGPAGLPLRRWHARRLQEPVAWAARMFMLGDPITEAEARLTLGSGLLIDLVEAGFVLACDRDAMVCPFDLVAAGGVYVICDSLKLGEQAVMGAGSTTGALWQAARPDRPVTGILDLGCGAGSCALLLADRAGSVLATDINPRAVTLSKINAVLNGIANAEFREGDLFGPVAGETFDLIVSQPPYYARPPESENRVYLFGGPRGDELSLKILAEVPRYLNPGGRAVLLAEWPLVAGDLPEDRIRTAVAPSGASVLFLRHPARDPNEFAVSYALFEHPEMGEACALAAVRWREHLDRMGIQKLSMGFVIVYRSPEGHQWTGVVDIPRQEACRVTSQRIDKMIAAREALAAGPEGLLSRCLRIPDGTRFAREYAPGKPPPLVVRAQFPPEAVMTNIELGAGAQLLLTLMHEATDVRSAVQRFADDNSLVFDAALSRMLPHIRQALLSGLLEAQDAFRS